MPKKTISIPKNLGGPKKAPVASKRTVGVAKLNDGLDGMHVGGIPIEKFPPEARAQIFYEQTDEAIREFNRGKHKPSGIELGADPFDKSVQERRDFIQNEDEPWLAPSLTRMLADKHVKRGFRPRFISEERANQEGNYARGWEIVKGKNGEPIRYKTQVLAQMPEDQAQRRNKFYQDKGNESVRQVYAAAHARDGNVKTARQLGVTVEPEEYVDEQQIGQR